MKKLLLGIVFLLVLQACQGVRSEQEGVEISSVSPGAMRAIASTKNDFVARLAADQKFDWEYAEYMSNIDNYSVSVRDAGDYLVVEYLVKQPKSGSVIAGGGGSYRVDKKTNRIMKFEGYK